MSFYYINKASIKLTSFYYINVEIIGKCKNVKKNIIWKKNIQVQLMSFTYTL